MFEITEGKVVEIERLSFVGNRAFSDRRLRQVLETKQAGLLRNLIQRDTFVAERLELDKQVLTDFYLSRGYIDFQILDATRRVVSRERDATFVTFTMREGRSFTHRQGHHRVRGRGRLMPPNSTPCEDCAPADLFARRLIDNNIARMETLALKQGAELRPGRAAHHPQ